MMCIKILGMVGLIILGVVLIVVGGLGFGAFIEHIIFKR